VGRVDSVLGDAVERSVRASSPSAAAGRATLVDDVWRPTATEQLERRRAGAPATHRLLLLPGVSRRARRLLGPIQSLLVDG